MESMVVTEVWPGGEMSLALVICRTPKDHDFEELY